MAVVRARSSPPYGLFAAMAFAVLMTGAAVVFYLLWSKSIDEHDRAVAALNKIASAADVRVLPNLVPNYSDANTAVAQLNAQLAKLKTDLAAARNTLDQVTADRDGKAQTVADVNILAKSAGDRAVTLEKNMNEMQKAFDDKTASLQDLIKKLNESFGATGATHDAALKKLQDDMNKALDAAEVVRRGLVLQLEDSQGQITKLNSEVFDLRQRIANFGGKSDVSVGEADGRILRVNGATLEAYINIGKNDRVMPGMSFTAYDPRTGVRFDTEEAALGNGSLEVLEVGETSSLCRVTRSSKGRAIQANDLIANVVYHNDRTRKFRFTVFGDFDLDGDGVATAAERDRLVVLIQRWGGQVDDDVSSQTDYLVLGEKPKAPMLEESPAADTAPATAPAGATVVVPGSVAEARSNDQTRYDTLTIAAKRLGIPVLNANRFLAMVGYYNTTVVRY